MKFLKPQSPIQIEEKYVKHINYSGLKGRIVTLPANNPSKKQDIVLIAGHHTSHERMLAFGEFLRDFGDVHMIDLPGFGGMDNFLSIGKPINYESYAEYIYTILKTQKYTDNLLVFAVSIGSEFVTRMFQMYPDSQKWFKRYVAFVGFGAAKDFNIKPFPKTVYKIIATIASSRIGSFFAWLVFLNRLSLIPFMEIFGFFKRKMQSEDPAKKREMIKMEKYLWYVNDLRTQAITTKQMFSLDLRTTSKAAIDVEFHNIVTGDDQYFDVKEVRKTFRDLYNNYHEHTISLGVHMPSMLDGKEQVASLFDKNMIQRITK